MALNIVEYLKVGANAALGITTDSLSSEGLTADKKNNDVAQILMGGLNIAAEVPGPNPLNVVTVLANYAALQTNTLVFKDDNQTPTISGNIFTSNAFTFLSDVGTEVSDAVGLIGSMGLFFGFPVAYSLKVAANLLFIETVEVNAGSLAQSAYVGLLQNSANSLSGLISSIISPSLIAVIGQSGSLVLSDITSILLSIATSAADYNADITTGFQSATAQVTADINSLQNDASNFLSFSGASNSGPVTASGSGQSVTITNYANSISGLSTQTSTGNEQTVSLTDTSTPSPVNISGTQLLNNDGSETLSLQYTSPTNSETTQLQVSGVSVLTQTVTLGGISIVAPLTSPVDTGYDTNGQLMAVVPVSGPVTTVSVTQTSSGGYDVEEGDPQQIVDFAPGGLTGGTIDISQNASGAVDLTDVVGNGDTAEISSDDSLSDVVQDFDFSGASETLKLDSPSQFAGTVFDFAAGDTIDLVGIAAYGATIATGDLLTLSEAQGGSIELRLASQTNYSDTLFEAGPDGSGGTKIIDVQVNDITYGSNDPTFAGGLNNNGQVVGDFDPNKSGTDIGFIYSGGSFSTVEVPGVAETLLDGINDSGEVVGLINGYNPASNPPVAFTEYNGAISPFTLPSLPPPSLPQNLLNALGISSYTVVNYGQAVTSVSAINDDGDVVGDYSYDYTGVPNETVFGISAGFLDENGKFSAITDPLAISWGGGLQIDEQEYLTGINDAGQIIGYYGNSSFLYSNGTFTPIEFPGAYLTRVEGINDYGQISGYSQNIDGSSNAFILSNGTYIGIDDPSGYGISIGGINDSGQVVGAIDNSPDGIGTVTAFETVIPGNSQVACYLTGTRVATPHGAISVESLAAGNLVRTHAGELMPVKWAGYRYVNCARHPRPQDVWPVHICPDAFGPGMPHCDLWLSPDHAVFVDGVLIPIKHLINGATVVQEQRDSVTYWHVELERHDVILAEGLPCESYLDTGNRSAFANGGSIVHMHPDFALCVWEAEGCAPLVVSGPKFDAARQRLAARAAVIVSSVPPAAKRSIACNHNIRQTSSPMSTA